MQSANSPTPGRIQEQLITHLPLMWFSLAFILGIVLASLVSLSIWVWMALSVLFLIVAFSTRFLPPFESLRAIVHPFIFTLLFATFLGGARYQLSVPNFDAFHIAFYNDRDYDLFITGTLIEPPDYRDNYTNLRVSVN